jgi:hypothetical protein
MNLADSLRIVIAQKDSLLEAAATRTVHITTPVPSVAVNVASEAWWNTPIVGGAIAFFAGMLTPLVVSFAQRRARRRRVVRLVGTELGILQFRMIATSLSLAERLNRLDRKMMATLRDKITARRETGDLKVVRRYIDGLDALPPEGLAAWQARAQGAGRALTLRQYDLPYLESSLPDLHLLRPGTQSLLFQLRGSLRLFNDFVADALRYHWLTFETLQDQNRDAVEQNIRSTRGHALDMALRVVSTISTVLDESDFKNVKPSQAQVDPPPVELEPRPS